MIYVDELQVSLKNKNWPYKYHCHLVTDSDSIRELHLFAIKLGLRRSWFQEKTLPHYDLTTRMRIKAIRLGAMEIDKDHFVQLLRDYRNESLK